MKTKALLISVIFFLVVAFVFIFPFFSVLSISNRKNPSEKIHFENGARGFIISYTHSVNKGRVHDYYRADGKNLILYRTDFVSYGAGMPEIEETPDAVFYQAGETYTMEYERNVPAMPGRTGAIHIEIQRKLVEISRCFGLPRLLLNIIGGIPPHSYIQLQQPGQILTGIGLFKQGHNLIRILPIDFTDHGDLLFPA